MISTDERSDVVVVGGGSAGSVIASRLSENPDRTVTVLEAGYGSGPEAMMIPSRWPELLGSEIDWGLTTARQPLLGGRMVPYPRGKVLGGCSSINVMVHLRGHRLDYDGWAAGGAHGWSYDELLPYFRRTEHTTGRDERLRGLGGPMRVGPVEVRHPVSQGCLAALAELGLPLSEDLNGRDQEGGAWLDFTITGGARQSAYEAYLRPWGHRPNLRVVCGGAVRSLLIEDGRCTGAEYVVDGELRTVHAGQVVLSAGAIGSPQLLMLSGVGPAAELERHGITVRAHAPEVGRNLQDHVLAGVVYATREQLPRSPNVYCDALAALRTRADLAQPDVQILFGDIPFHPAVSEGPAHGFTLLVSQLQPHSRGTVSLSSADPAAPPCVDPRYFEDPRDLDTMVAGLRLARRIGESAALAHLRDEEVLPGPEVDDERALAAYVQRAATTYFHPVGTCRLGNDPGAVVDTELRVNGIENLRVADASVMPTIVSANTNATVLAIAERAAEWMRG
ncbi:FAD-dependent oxidoreductase [Amycolatopsis endophytica]|uniref:Choline dehydrogenase n=2 Tax=Amycolatopsis endophytica TaxID=860233 RepID=A0A853B1F8_9PSEU|nr:choline dehydrogenase [Amycolatopsis endophytica]